MKGNLNLDALENDQRISESMRQAATHAPRGKCVAWGVPFEIGDVLLLADQPVEVTFSPLKAEWLVFLHTSDGRPRETNASGFISPMTGAGRLNEPAADYIIRYADGSRRRRSGVMSAKVWRT